MLLSVPLKPKVMSKQMLEYILATSEPSGTLKKRQPSVQCVPQHLSPKCPEVKRAGLYADCSLQARTQITNALSYTCYPMHLQGVELN